MMNIFRSKTLTKILPFLTARVHYLCTCRLQPDCSSTVVLERDVISVILKLYYKQHVIDNQYAKYEHPLIGLKMKVESVRQIFKSTVWYDLDLWLLRQICDLNPSL